MSIVANPATYVEYPCSQCGGWFCATTKGNLLRSFEPSIPPRCACEEPMTPSATVKSSSRPVTTTIVDTLWMNRAERRAWKKQKASG